MRGGRTALLAAGLVLLLWPARADALRGVGRVAVESVLESMPQDLDELRAEIEQADRALEQRPDDVEANLKRAVLMLNDTKGIRTVDVRAYLLRVVIADPSRTAAFELWDALIPGEEELEQAARGLSGQREAPALYARGWIALRRGEWDEAAKMAQRARGADAAFEARSLWLEALAAFLDGNDLGGTRLFIKATEAIGGSSAPPEETAESDETAELSEEGAPASGEAAPEAAPVEVPEPAAETEDQSARSEQDAPGELPDEAAAAAGEYQDPIFDDEVEFDREAVRVMVDYAIYVASPRELEGYNRKRGHDRGAWLRSFWKRRDVFPLTEAYERLGEHVRRVHDARQQFALSTNGSAYLTMRNTFKELSPDLRYYSSDLVFRAQERANDWLDHRGLVYVRHGRPDTGNKASLEGRSAETWLYFRHVKSPLIFHFIDRLGLGEHVLTLNLAQSYVSNRTPDDPKLILDNISRDFRELYQRRGNMHRLFMNLAVSKNMYEIESLLAQEAQLMGGFIKNVFQDDSSNLIGKDNVLPFAPISASFADENGLVDLYVYYAVPEHEIETEATELRFDASFVLYSSDWLEELRSAEHHFEFVRPPGKRDKKKENLLVGVMHLEDIEPGRYRYAMQVWERTSGKLGVSKGTESVAFYGEPFVDLSDLLLADEVVPIDEPSIFERQGMRVVPIPTRVLKKKAEPVQVYYEVYDLKSDVQGMTNYKLEYRLLKVQGQAGFFSKLLSIGMNVASAFFPYYTFLVQAGLFGIDILTTSESEGLETTEEVNQEPAEGRRVYPQIYTLEPQKMGKGIYQLYVTITDLNNGSLDTRSVRFAVTD